MRGRLYFLFMLHFSTGCILSDENQTTAVTAFAGGSVMLLCSCADPQSTANTFTWQFYSTEKQWIQVFEDEKYSSRSVLFNDVSPNNLSLLISDITKEDQGYYLCMTEQPTYMFLKVNEKPHIHRIRLSNQTQQTIAQQPHHTRQYVFILVTVFPLAVILPFLAFTTIYAKDEVACPAVVDVEKASTPDHNDPVELTEFINTNAMRAF